MTTTTTSTPVDTDLRLGQKFLLSTAAILGYMAVWALILLPPALLLSGDAQMIVLAVCGALIFLLYLPWFFWSTNHIWQFKGSGQPISFENLKKEILAINTFDSAVMVTEKNPRHLVVTWKYVDATWFEVFRKAGMTSTYFLHIKFNPEKNAVYLVDRTKTIKWHKGPLGFAKSFSLFSGILMNKLAIGKAWGIRENFSIGKLYDYKFSPEEIKNPVMNTILRSGWNLRFALV